MIFRLAVETHQRDELIDITCQVQNVVTDAAAHEGICTVYVPHTTAAVTIQENDDPNVAVDIIDGLDRLIPVKGVLPYKHIEENAPAHLKVALVGTSETLFVEEGKLQLGRWQSIFLCEFDGPRQREVLVKLSA
ncbi:MAG: hypothetical protein AUJ92_14360 [Armatimonadetes bacterium CG2_30_59_28]|nr:MAG: hypothetical protein AUJ92_14360 [Armatimonadetes bacterium CG2_30_59_28]